MKILLVCSAGMSTDILRGELIKYAKKEQLPLEVKAVGVHAYKGDLLTALLFLANSRIGPIVIPLKAVFPSMQIICVLLSFFAYLSNPRSVVSTCSSMCAAFPAA